MISVANPASVTKAGPVASLFAVCSATNGRVLSCRGVRRGLLGVLILWLTASLAGCGENRSSEAAASAFSGEIMGTVYHVKVVPGDDDLPGDLGQRIFDVLSDVDQRMSTYKPDSELNQLNRAEVGKAIPVSAPLLDVLTLSRKVYRESGGAFDPTVAPLVNLWGFGPDFHEDSIPAESAIAQLLAEVGYNHLDIDQEQAAVRKDRALSLDLSAVAKGYAVDQVAALLDTLDIANYMVEVGGEMAMLGHNDRGQPWQIAIEKPQASSRSVQQIVAIEEGAIATSGDYRNYFEKEGVRFSHTIDPRTGYPISHSLASVTVIADNCGYADALATAFMVMGAERALALAEERNIAVFTLSKTQDGFTAAHSSAFEPYLKETP